MKDAQCNNSEVLVILNTSVQVFPKLAFGKVNDVGR